MLTDALGAKRAKLYSAHSWRVWLASALRMCDASDPLIMAFGRWLNPESVKIYARLTTEEYAHWMNEIMKVSSIDAARTIGRQASANLGFGFEILFGDNKRESGTQQRRSEGNIL